MLEKSGNFAHASELVEFTSYMVFRSRCGKMARQRHLYSFSGEPSSYVSRTCMKIGTLMQHNNTYKKVSWSEIRNPTGSRYFEFSVIFSDILPFAGVIL